MNKMLGMLLVLPLAACGASDDKAVQACDTAFSALQAFEPPENLEKTKIEKREIKDGKVHLLIHTPNGKGDMIYMDINCVFKLDRQPAEKDATLKLANLEFDKYPESVLSIDIRMKGKGGKTVTEWLQEKGLDAFQPSETKLILKE